MKNIGNLFSKGQDLAEYQSAKLLYEKEQQRKAGGTLEPVVASDPVESMDVDGERGAADGNPAGRCAVPVCSTLYCRLSHHKGVDVAVGLAGHAAVGHLNPG